MENKKKVKDLKKLIIQIISIIVILLGIIILVYPKIANKNYEIEVHKLKDEFLENVNSLEENNPFVPLYNELQRRNEYLYNNNQKDLKDPFSYEQPNIDLSYFGIKNNIIGFLSIPKLEVELPIYLGANNDNMKKGAVHLTETSYPIGGENTNAVIAAHRGGYNADMFLNIEKLKIGDLIYIRNFQEELTYRVVETKVILPVDVYELLIKPGRDLVTLITCHPLGQNTKRYVVFTERVL